jgi:nucleoside diphosphate kinase/8-oxo-dGTP pyrophosphatase MutT (NUDIX family)
MSRTEQISAFVFRPSPENEASAEYLALRRSAARGGFWQGVTGGLEQYDAAGQIDGVGGTGSRPAAGAVREIHEELGLRPTHVYDTGYNFSFTDPKDGTLTEHVLAAQVDSTAEPTLSDEHDAAFWVSGQDMRELVGAKWPENVVGFDEADAIVRESFGEQATSTFGPNNWALVIEKPDAIELGIEKEIAHGLKERGLKIMLGARGVALNSDTVDKIWIPPKDKDPWYWSTVEYMSRRPVNVHLVHGEDASDKVMEMKMGLRKKYDKNYRDDESAPVERRVESVIHGSDRMEELARQALLFFDWSEVNGAIHDVRAK